MSSSDPIDTDAIREALEGEDAVVQSLSAAGRSIYRAPLKDQVDALFRLENRNARRAMRRARVRLE